MQATESTYFPGNYFSYTTCGGEDSWTGSEQQQEAANPPMYVCVEGQGQSKGLAVAISSHNSEASCAAECDEDAMCIGFDFTTNSQVDACRMYGANDPRTDGGRDNRQYCASEPQLPTKGE